MSSKDTDEKMDSSSQHKYVPGPLRSRKTVPGAAPASRRSSCSRQSSAICSLAQPEAAAQDPHPGVLPSTEDHFPSVVKMWMMRLMLINMCEYVNYETLQVLTNSHMIMMAVRISEFRQKDFLLLFTPKKPAATTTTTTQSK